MRFFHAMRKKRGLARPCDFARRRYSEELTHIESLAVEGATPEEKAGILTFAIDVIARELAAENTALFVRGSITDTMSGNEWDIPLAVPYETRYDVDVSRYHVVSRPWREDRLVEAIRHSLTPEGRDGPPATTATLYEELDLVISGNRRHRQTATKHNSGCSIEKLYIIRLADIFDRLTTDGWSWSYEQDGTPVKMPCLEYRMALLYQLAGLRHEVLQGAEIGNSRFGMPMRFVAGPKEEMGKNISDGGVQEQIRALEVENKILLRQRDRLIKLLRDSGLSEAVDPLLKE